MPPEILAKYGFQIKEILQADIFSNHIKLPDDIQIRQSQLMTSILSGPSGTFNDPLQINTLHKSSGENLQNIIRNAGGG